MWHLLRSIQNKAGLSWVLSDPNEGQVYIFNFQWASMLIPGSSPS